MTDTCSLAYAQGTKGPSMPLSICTRTMIVLQSLEGSVESKNQALLCPIGHKNFSENKQSKHSNISLLEIRRVSKMCTLDGRIVIPHVLS